MKKIFLSLILLAGTITTIVSCSDENLDPVASSSSINMTSPIGGTFVLTGSTAGTDAFTAKWTPAEFGFSAAVTYSLQAIKSTESFSNASQAIVLGTYNSSLGVNEKSLEKECIIIMKKQLVNHFIEMYLYLRIKTKLKVLQKFVLNVKNILLLAQKQTHTILANQANINTKAIN